MYRLYHLKDRFEVEKTWHKLLPTFAPLRKYINTPENKIAMLVAFKGRLLIDFDVFIEDFERLHDAEYNSDEYSFKDIIVRNYSIEAYELIYSLLYTGTISEFYKEIERKQEERDDFVPADLLLPSFSDIETKNKQPF